MSKKAMWAEVLIFLLFIGALFRGQYADTPRGLSPSRKTAFCRRCPALRLSGFSTRNLQREFEDYTSDQFIFRDEWITLKAASELALGKKENNDVSYGKEQTLIEGFDAPDKSTLDTNMSYVNQLVQNTDANVYFALIPEKSEIWSDRLPNLTPNDSQAELIEYCYGLSNANNVDMLAPLREHADEYIYYRTDHHWTSLGAYYGFTALGKAMGYRRPRAGQLHRPPHRLRQLLRHDLVVERLQLGKARQHGGLCERAGGFEDNQLSHRQPRGRPALR